MPNAFLWARCLLISYEKGGKKKTREKSLRFSLEGCKSLNYELYRYLQAWPR